MNYKLLLRIGVSFFILVLLFGFSAGGIPIMANIELTSLSDNSMIITWSTTNEASSTEIVWRAGGLTNITTIAGTTKYHYVELTGLYQNTTYQYRIKSGDVIFPPPPLFSPQSFTTLAKPSGEYLFSFAVLNDLRYANGKASTKGSRGIPYAVCAEIMSSHVADINSYVGPNGASGVAFTVINGNLAESSGTYGDQVGAAANLKGKLDLLTGASNFTSNISYKYLPVPGYQDKKAVYTTDWITDAFAPLTNQTSIETTYGYRATSKEVDSVFNYNFEYKDYNFIFLDSVKKNGTGGAADLTFLKNKIAGSLKKTFIFMSFPAYNPFETATKDYPLNIPTSEVGGDIINIENYAAFQDTIEAYTDASGNPIVAAVIGSHLGDNYNREISNISYVRQGPALQYPTGYSIYKVYSTGYVKTFYKTTDRDGTDKPYYEHARDQISAETVSGQAVPAEALTQFWLGSSSSRNFTYSYAFIPGLSPKVLGTGPVSNETGAGLNSPILITFNKRMSTQGLGTWITITNTTDNTALAVSAEEFIDASRTVLKVTHPDFTVDKTYRVTVSGSKAMDEGSTAMAADFIFSFNTSGGTKDEIEPSAHINLLSDNSSDDPFPNFTGIATDESRIITVQYRFDNTGNWVLREAVDGQFTGTTEVFQIKPTSPLSEGPHTLWLKTIDGIGNTSSSEGFLAYSFSIVFGGKPSISSVKFDGNSISVGEAIDATPRIEITIASNNSVTSAKLTLDSTEQALTLLKVNTSYYTTYEVATALADGAHGITIEAFDANGNGATYEVFPLYVQAVSGTSIQGTPLNYPNPFDPGTQSTAISYTLSKSSNISLSIFDLSGNLIYKNTYTSSQAGGKAGYNEVAWDGKSSSGNYVSNGIYTYLIIVDGEVIQNGKGKISIFKQ